MKHSSTRAFYSYWDQQRGDALAPDRNAMDPSAVRDLLGDSFVLTCDYAAAVPFRMAGTRLCGLLGRDLKAESFLALWTDTSRREVEDLIGITTDESLATVAGVTASAETGAPVYLELLLLPVARSVHALHSVTGLLVPLTAPAHSGYPRLERLSLTTWRHEGHRTRTIAQRAIRRLALARGFMAYEGRGGDT